jgi:hypothetical protein
MYILVQHTISDPDMFWNTVDPATLPSAIKLHHTFPTQDGSHAACLWEADSASDVRDFLEPVIGRYSRNEYFAVENREGVALPSGVERAERTRT